MTSYTPILNLPYVTPTDTPVSYPVVSQDLATKLDTAVVRKVFSKTTDASGFVTLTNTELGLSAITGLVAGVAHGNSNGNVCMCNARRDSATAASVYVLKWTGPGVNPIALSAATSLAVVLYILAW